MWPCRVLCFADKEAEVEGSRWTVCPWSVHLSTRSLTLVCPHQQSVVTGQQDGEATAGIRVPPHPPPPPPLPHTRAARWGAHPPPPPLGGSGGRALPPQPLAALARTCPSGAGLTWGSGTWLRTSCQPWSGCVAFRSAACPCCSAVWRCCQLCPHAWGGSPISECPSPTPASPDLTPEVIMVPAPTAPFHGPRDRKGGFGRCALGTTRVCVCVCVCVCVYFPRVAWALTPHLWFSAVPWPPVLAPADT